MPTTRVLEFTCFKFSTGLFAVVPTMATMKTIDLLGGRAVKNSEQVVDNATIDSMGYYPTTDATSAIHHDARAYLVSLGFRPAKHAGDRFNA